MRITALILFLFISSTFTISQSAWTRVTPRPQENHINDVTKIPGTDKIIAVSDGSTVMISDDGGESWQMILNPGGLANDYPLNTVYFYNSLVGFIGGHYYEFMNIQDYILKTEDGGITWQVNNNLPTGTYVYDFYFVNQNTGFVAGYNNLLKTTDGGQNWFEVETNATFHLNSIDFCNDSTGYIVGDSYESILKTTDFGNTWSEVFFTSPLTGGELRRIQFIDNTIGFVVQNFGDILKTTNAGVSWDIIFTDQDINAFSIDFYDENHGVAGCYQDYIQSCIISTNDGANTWSDYTLPVFQNLSYSVCALNSSDFLFCGIQGMMFQSENGGDSWNPVSERELWGDIIQVQHIENNTVFCLAFNDLYSLDQNISLYKSINGGVSFNSIADFLVIDQNMHTEAAFHFLDTNIGFLTYNNNDLLTVLKTVDGGFSWTEVESGNYGQNPITIKFYDEQNGLIMGTGHLVLKTTDSGNTWQNINSNLNFHYVLDIHYFTNYNIIASGAFLWGGSMSKLVISYDGGNTWEDMILGEYGTIYDIEVINNNTIYLACRDNALLKSPDGGDTWQYTNINTPNDIEFHSIHFPSENIGYAVGTGPYETMVKTTDGGLTWNVMNSGSTSGLNVVHFIDEYTGYVYGDKGVVLKTTTGGTTDIKEYPLENSKSYLKVYPNPFTQSFSIQYFLPDNSNDGTIEIFSQSGNRKLKQQIKNSIGKIELQSENLKPGFYLISLKIDNTIIETQKIIKLH